MPIGLSTSPTLLPVIISIFPSSASYPAPIYNSDGSGKRRKFPQKVLNWWSPADKRVLAHFVKMKHNIGADSTGAAGTCPGTGGTVWGKP